MPGQIRIAAKCQRYFLKHCAQPTILQLLCPGMNIIEAARRSLQDSSSSSSKRPGSPSSSSQDWCPVLPAARDVLPAVLVHTQGVSKAVGWLQLQQQGPEDTSLKQQPGRGKKKAASAGVSPDFTPAAESRKPDHVRIQLALVAMLMCVCVLVCLSA
jgi:hypothetical protein